MKLEELLGFNDKEFRALTDIQLQELCKPYFNITRPELTTKTTNVTFSSGKILSKEDKEKAEKRKMAIALMAKHGIKL